MKLTRRQREVLEFIKQSIARQGFPPSIREIGEHFGIYPRAVLDHVRALERKGFVRRRAAKSRAIEVVDFPEKPLRPDTREVPLLRRVAVRRPFLVAEDVEATVAVAREWTGDGEVFLFRVRGGSMAPFILEGDLVLVSSQTTVEGGDVVLALAGREAVVRRLRREDRFILLEPENPAWKSLRFGEDSPDLRILGRVIGIYRRL
ncbi:MAG: repressor LexA [Deltaproteobacteria bacterium]|nr:repressor LexA [Deltaproteobacteria bacterium]MBW2120488.1 repressor LexA [Deltaproteobacteria bacterium]